MITFRNYLDEDYQSDYQSVCDFLIELNERERNHINWNWARWEWMYRHPEFDNSLIGSIGLWLDGERIVGAAIYDMYFGEGFCGALPEYDRLYPEILDYACGKLSDEDGFAFAICESDDSLIEAARKAGFAKADQSEHMLSIPLEGNFAPALPEGYSLAELDPVKELCEFQWLLWQGFDHGDDRAAFELENDVTMRITEFRRHFNPELSVAAVNGAGENGAYCCMWYDARTDYAYVEPVCVIPSFRGKGIGKAVVQEALRRAKALGAECAYVISDMDFYRKLGFADDRHFSFWRKK